MALYSSVRSTTALSMTVAKNEPKDKNNPLLCKHRVQLLYKATNALSVFAQIARADS